MLVLALESSAQTASAALVTETAVLAEISLRNKKTHSQTLMPAVDFIMKASGAELDDVDYIAVSAGPGSFTGLRIGAATAKALAHGAGKMIIPVPTLDAITYNVFNRFKLCVPIMDARRDQVYACIYENAGGVLNKLTPYMAEDLNRVLEMALSYGSDAIFLGDGANVFYDRVLGYSERFNIAPINCRLQSAASVGLAALSGAYAAAVYTQDPVIYLRKPQAEREYEGKNHEH